MRLSRSCLSTGTIKATSAPVQWESYNHDDDHDDDDDDGGGDHDDEDVYDFDNAGKVLQKWAYHFCAKYS